MAPTLSRLPAGLLLALAACAAPATKNRSLVDLRVCVESEELVEAYAKYFKAATAAGPRGGRDCDLTARADSALNSGNVTLRSAYDGSTLAEIEGTVDLVPRLAAMALEDETEPYRRVVAQRAASGFTR